MIPFIAKAKKNPITKEVKYYAQVAPVDHVELLSITSSISEKCTVTEHDVKAVLSALQMSIAKHITDGNSVRFGDLGSFRLTIKGTPADTKEKGRTRQTLWRAVQMLTQKLCCQTIHDCPKVVPLHYESE